MTWPWKRGPSAEFSILRRLSKRRENVNAVIFSFAFSSSSVLNIVSSVSRCSFLVFPLRETVGLRLSEA